MNPKSHHLSILLIFFALISPALSQQVRINEVVSSNSLYEDRDGNTPDWFELHNSGSTEVDLSDWTVTDKKDKPQKWTFPQRILAPDGYLHIWASGKDRRPPLFPPAPAPPLHTNFRIAAEGEALYLFDPAGSLVDSMPAVTLPADMSVGIAADGSLRFFETPTPGQPNGGPSYTGISQASIVFSHPGGQVDTFSLRLSGVAPTDTIRYTLDGSIPRDTSRMYTGPIPVHAHAIVRARVFYAGYRPSAIQTHSYFVGTDHKLPIISLVTEPANFFDVDSGIYVYGTDFSPDLPYFGANFWEDWERPIHLSFFEKDGRLGLDIDAGVKIFGAWSRAFEQRSLSIFARSKYGFDEIDYPLFPQLPYDTFQAFVLRNSGTDWLNSMMRDAVLTGLMHDTDLSVQAYRPAVTYLNGKYWGFYNMREKINEHFLASKHGVDPDELDILEAGGDIVQGSNRDYNNLMNFVRNNNLAFAQNYDYVAGRMDIDNYILYNVAQIYFDNTDWPGNNVKFWRPIGGKWKWILYDTDFGFGIWNTYNFTNNTLRFALEANGPGWPNPPWSTLLLRKLTQNQAFRHQFINQFADELNSRFLADRVTRHIDSLAAGIQPEIATHLTAWGGDYGSWQGQVINMKTFANNRLGHIKRHIRDQFGLPAYHRLRIENETPELGYVQVNSLTIREPDWQGDYFQSVPISLKAFPMEGYSFSHWGGARVADSTQLEISVDMKRAMTIVPYFIEEAIPVGNIVINEINYLSNPAVNTDDWVELYNISDQEIDLSDWELKAGSSPAKFVFPSGTKIAGNGYLLVVRSSFNFRKVYPEMQQLTGGFSMDFSDQGDAALLLDKNGVQQDLVTYLPVAPWPLPANGKGPTLELISPDLDNSLPESWASIHTVGSPGESNMGTSRHFFEGIKPYPNPFQHQLYLDFHLVGTTYVVAELFDMSGAKVLTLLADELETGEHRLKVYVPFLSRGLYFLRVQKGTEVPITWKWIKGR